MGSRGTASPSRSSPGPRPEVEQKPPEPPFVERVFGGLLWMYAGNGATIVLQTVIVAVLARLVAPEEFGLVAAALVVESFGRLLAMAGLDTAVVQRKVLTEAHLRAAFGASLLLATLTGLLFWFAAPQLAALVGLPDVAPLLRLLAFSFLIREATMGPRLLTRELRFRPLALTRTFSFALGYGVVAIVLALRGWGAEALIVGHLGEAVVATVTFWIVRPHSMRPSLSPGPLRDLLRVGVGESLSRLIGAIGSRGDSFIVGRWLGAAALGFYSRAYRLMEMPTLFLSQGIRRVLFPAMSGFQDDPGRLGRTYVTGIGALAAMTLPVSVALAVVADEMVLVLLGPDWTDVVPVLRVLIIGMTFRANPAISNSVILACGAVYRQAGRVALFAVLVVSGALIGRPWGVVGVAWGILLAMCFNYLAMAYISLDLTGVPWRRFWSVQRPALLLGAIVGLVAWPTAWVTRSLDVPALLVLAAVAVASALAEVATVRAAPVTPGLGSLDSLVRRVHRFVPGRAGEALGRVIGPRYRDVVVVGEERT